MDQALLRLPEQVDGTNVLVLPRDADVLALATAWFSGAAWDREPVAARPAVRPMTGARFRGMSAEAAPATSAGLLALVPGVTLRGPVALDAADARAAGLGARDVDLYALDAAPGAGLEVVHGWMSAAARRVGGGIVPADRSRLVAPDPGAAVDLTLWSAQALAPRDAMPLVRPAMRGARVGPPEPGDTLAVTAMFEYDGAVSVRTSRADQVPVVLSALDWREYGPWAYRVVWEPPDPEQLLAETPSQLHLIARSRVQPSVARIAAALRQGAGGTVVDSGGFVVTPDELREMATAAR